MKWGFNVHTILKCIPVAAITVRFTVMAGTNQIAEINSLTGSTIGLQANTGAEVSPWSGPNAI